MMGNIMPNRDEGPAFVLTARWSNNGLKALYLMIFQNGARKEQQYFAQKNPNSYILLYLLGTIPCRPRQNQDQIRFCI